MNSRDYIRKYFKTDTTFPERLISARKAAKLTKTELAKYIDSVPSVISKYENGTRYPTDENMYKLSEALNINPNKLKYGYDTVLFNIGDGFLISHYHINQDPKKGLKFYTDPTIKLYRNEQECIDTIKDTIDYLLKNKDFEYLSTIASIASYIKACKKTDIDIKNSKKKKQ